MLASIVSYGLAIGAIYALIGITYNVMFSASRVFSFTAGALGMLGGVFGALVHPAGSACRWSSASSLTLAAGALIGVVTEIVAVRPVLKSLEQHLYVLSTLAFALMIQQFTAIEWSTEPQPFPRLLRSARGAFDQQFWLPVLACAATIVGLELLYRRTLVGRAFLAIAEDNYAARALGLPERNLRMASFALAGVIGSLAGFAGGEVLLAFFANEPMLNFYGFVPVALGGMGNNRGAVIGGFALGLFQQAANFLVGGVFASVAVFAVFIIVLLARPEGLAGATDRPPRMMDAPQSRRTGATCRRTLAARARSRSAAVPRAGRSSAPVCRCSAATTGASSPRAPASTGCWSPA